MYIEKDSVMNPCWQVSYRLYWVYILQSEAHRFQTHCSGCDKGRFYSCLYHQRFLRSSCQVLGLRFSPSRSNFHCCVSACTQISFCTTRKWAAQIKQDKQHTTGRLLSTCRSEGASQFICFYDSEPVGATAVWGVFQLWNAQGAVDGKQVIIHTVKIVPHT